jgi:hypothetical protein
VGFCRGCSLLEFAAGAQLKEEKDTSSTGLLCLLLVKAILSFKKRKTRFCPMNSAVLILRVAYFQVCVGGGSSAKTCIHLAFVCSGHLKLVYSTIGTRSGLFSIIQTG